MPAKLAYSSGLTSKVGQYNIGNLAIKPERQARKQERDGVSVLPGRAPSTSQASASDTIVLLARILIIGILLFAAIGVVRITLSSATVACALETKQIQNQISDEREIGSSLEVTQSSLSNPTRIKSEANGIGMSIPNNIKVMDLSGDVVVTDSAGALSLSSSTEALSKLQ